MASSGSLQTSPDPGWGGKGVLDGESEADAGPPPSSQPGSEISFLAVKWGPAGPLAHRAVMHTAPSQCQFSC